MMKQMRLEWICMKKGEIRVGMNRENAVGMDIQEKGGDSNGYFQDYILQKSCIFVFPVKRYF